MFIEPSSAFHFTSPNRPQPKPAFSALDPVSLAPTADFGLCDRDRRFLLHWLIRLDYRFLVRRNGLLRIAMFWILAIS